MSVAPLEPQTVVRSVDSTRRLGIPSDARRVLVFSESSHWDTNWLKTSDEYFEARLEPIFAQVMDALEHDPHRVYCIESLFFLKLYWERHPEAQSRLRALLEPTRGTPKPQLRILGASFTTPDTLLPHTEALLRDYLLGQDWLKSVGLAVHPTTAYFPDNFGHSPHLPSLMRAVGVDSVGVTRIDGMYFVASDFRARSSFPLKGSTAELLQKELRTLDFIWQDDDGAEVLCHWNAFGYFQGDMLAHAGIVRWNGHVAAVPWRTRNHIARRIAGFVRELEPLALTRYLLCPIGMDFNDPIALLPELLDRYNRERYGDTGVWTVLAGLDDYLEWVGEHRASLPVLSVDPNPYWMGFYASRPELKQRPTRIARSLVLAEKLSSLAPPDPAIESALRDGWMNVVLMNHHDAITGTSPDRVTHGEQRGWLEKAELAAHEAVRLASASYLATAGKAADASGDEPKPTWTRTRDGVEVRTEHYFVAFSEKDGGAMTSLVAFGREQLGGLGFDLVAHADEGGLWRLGHEFKGGGFAIVDRTSQRKAVIDVVELTDGLSVVVHATLEGQLSIRTASFRAGDPFIRLSVEVAASRRHTLTCRFDMADRPATLEMDTIGGTIERPRERIHQPTFWPVPSTLSLRGSEDAIHLGFEAPTAVSFSPAHELEWIVARNCTKERAFWVLPVLAHPIGGTTDEVQLHHAALFATHGDIGHVVPPNLRRALELVWFPDELHATKRFARSRVVTDDPTVTFSAIKRADFGPGIIVRCACDSPRAQVVRVGIADGQVARAYLSDARESDGPELEVVNGEALVTIARRLTTLRLVPR